MLRHAREKVAYGGRTIILGAGGFVGSRLAVDLVRQGAKVMAITSGDIDLCSPAAGEALAARLDADDSLVMLSALTPARGRDIATLMRNLAMVQSVADALQTTMVKHVTYVSSDAVYTMDHQVISETTCADPQDLYGVMHKCREVMMADAVPADRLAILRPTLIYGQGDPHNSYGPNRLRRMARDKGEVTLFGEGEETRDHIYVGDVVRLIGLVLGHGSSGLLNVATGEAVSFDELAQKVAAQFEPPAKVTHTERNNPITHRRFDITALKQAFPNFAFTPLQQGLAQAHADAAGAGG